MYRHFDSMEAGQQQHNTPPCFGPLTNMALQPHIPSRCMRVKAGRWPWPTAPCANRASASHPHIQDVLFHVDVSGDQWRILVCMRRLAGIAPLAPSPPFHGGRKCRGVHVKLFSLHMRVGLCRWRLQPLLVVCYSAPRVSRTNLILWNRSL
jgi:hypothetical protein